jgi:hypothetical protein
LISAAIVGTSRQAASVQPSRFVALDTERVLDLI